VDTDIHIAQSNTDCIMSINRKICFFIIVIVSPLFIFCAMAPRSVRSACDCGSKATLAKVHRMGDQNFLPRAPPRFGSTLTCWSLLHLQSLAPIPFPRRVDVRQAAVRKKLLPNFIPNSLSVIRVGKRRQSHLYPTRTYF
jgi:hypothetical protein